MWLKNVEWSFNIQGHILGYKNVYDSEQSHTEIKTIFWKKKITTFQNKSVLAATQLYWKEEKGLEYIIFFWQ